MKKITSKDNQLYKLCVRLASKKYRDSYGQFLVEGEKAQEIMKKVQKDTIFKLNPYVDGQGAVQEFVPWNNVK